MPFGKKLAAEFAGTFRLVLGGCGSAVLAAGFPGFGIGFAGIALAFGLTLLTMAYAIGHISGCHLNPAVSVGLWAGGRFPAAQLPGYIIAQVLAATLAAGLCLTLIHLISIPVTNTSVNPARSTGPALIVGDRALSQLSLFWVAPLISAAIAGLVYRNVFEKE